jgi:hypothetical protein
MIHYVTAAKRQTQLPDIQAINILENHFIAQVNSGGLVSSGSQ